jgi:hypothetical protein
MAFIVWGRGGGLIEQKNVHKVNLPKKFVFYSLEFFFLFLTFFTFICLFLKGFFARNLGQSMGARKE